MDLKKENLAFERYLDGVIKYGLRHANMKTEHFQAMIKRYKDMEKVIQAARAVSHNGCECLRCIVGIENLEDVLKEYDEA